MGEHKLLDSVSSPGDLKKLQSSDLPRLAQEIREELIDTVSKTGGHLASNLGAVELTIALHRVFNSPDDKIIFDVGHQCYTHKLLTDRKEVFNRIRQSGGISGFTRRNESEHDILSGGHSSVAISAAYGIAVANKLKGKNDYAVAVVGDGAFTGGMVYEALNNAGRAGQGTKLIIILNDNEMSISPNVGALARYLATIKANPRYFRLKAKTESIISKIPLFGKSLANAVFRLKTAIKNKVYKSTMFEDLGFRYMGPIDGHDIPRLCLALEGAKEANYPVVLHINTVKGKGYAYAESHPDEYHGVSAFDPESGSNPGSADTFSTTAGSFLTSAAAKDKRVCCVTAAMGLGTGLEYFRTKFPSRFFDVGIAEEHAVTFSAGLARGGMLPVFAVYSTFLQRGYDQIIHDCSMQKLKVVFAIDRAGFACEDGESHHGIFDTAFLNSIPDITLYSPSCFAELNSAFVTALYHSEGTVAVRYPKGPEPVLPPDFIPGNAPFSVYGNISSPAAIVTYGRLFEEACKAKKLLEDAGIKAFIIKLNRIKPIDNNAVVTALKCKAVCFFEEAQCFGGIGETFADKLLKFGYAGKYINTAVKGEFPKQGRYEELLKHYRLDGDSMAQIVSELFNN